MELGITMSELRERVTLRELAEWQAWFEWRADQHKKAGHNAAATQLAQLVASGKLR